MPVYQYQVILDGGIEGPVFEVQQPASEPPLTRHPVTGHAVRRVITAPNISTRYTPGREKKLTETRNVEKAGFTKYERDKSTGLFHKTAGKDKNAPDILNPRD